MKIEREAFLFHGSRSHASLPRSADGSARREDPEALATADAVRLEIVEVDREDGGDGFVLG
jgi:hypothetical protein